VAGLARAGWPVWFSGLCWSVMFTAFMLAITLTTVANVLVTMAIGPLITALFTRLFLRHRLPARTWLAIAVGGVGIAWMFGQEAKSGLSLPEPWSPWPCRWPRRSTSRRCSTSGTAPPRRADARTCCRRC
jgi:drug/metabolite transporter (DMT)-like permease